MNTLKPLALGNLIRSQIRPNDILFTPMTTTSEDMKNIWNFLKHYEGMFINTLILDDIDINQGLDGRSLCGNQKAISGFLYDEVTKLPKTIAESLTELYKAIDVKILDSDLTTEIAEVKDVIGLSRFYDGMPSSDGSINNDLEHVGTMLNQLAADVFNRGTSIGDAQDDEVYNFNDDGKQTQGESIKDLLMRVVNAHSGLSKIDHSEVTVRHVWGLSLPSDLYIEGGDELFTTVFATGNIYDEYETAQRFYNPFSSNVTIKGLSIAVLENTLHVTSSVTLYVNGAPTSLDLKLLYGAVGQFKNGLINIVLGPNDYIQFGISAGQIPEGNLKISNLSVIIEENN